MIKIKRYEAFDFHKQCGNDRWDRLSILINRLANDQDDINYVGVFRIPGMKNPAKTKIACFDLNEDGVKINYLPNTPGMMEAVANATDPKVGDDILPVMTTATGGGEGFLRKTRKNRD